MGIINYFEKLILKKAMLPQNAGILVFNKFNFNYFFAKPMAILLQKIANDFGEKYLFDLGYKAGDDTREEMYEKMHTDENSAAKNLEIIKTMCEVLGFGKFEIEKMIPSKGILVLRVWHNPVIDESFPLFGKESKVGALHRGIYSVHAEKHVKVKDCSLIETKSITLGDKYNEWSTGILSRKKT